MSAVVTFSETLTRPVQLEALYDAVEGMRAQCSQLNISAYDVTMSFVERAGYSDPRPGEESPGSITLTATVTLRKD